jgi:hypothetical protein
MSVVTQLYFQIIEEINYEGHSEVKERFAIKKYLLIIGKKENMWVLSHTFTYFSTQSRCTLKHLSYRDTSFYSILFYLGLVSIVAPICTAALRLIVLP